MFVPLRIECTGNGKARLRRGTPEEPMPQRRIDVTSPKDAVQPGRRIASFGETAGLGVPVAMMTL
jgi:hypothetical protein